MKPAKPVLKARSLGELQAIQLELAKVQTLAAARAKAAELASRQTQAAANLFARAAGAVQPLTARAANGGRASLDKARPAPLPKQQWQDDKAVLQEALSDEFDVGTLLEVDDALSFRRPGIGSDVLRKLRRGDWAIQKELDLHGLRREQARDALADFIRTACKLGLRCIRVVHGKGLGSPGKEPVLKGRVQSWLIQKQEVLAFVQARPADGGAGALLVLLRPGMVSP